MKSISELSQSIDGLVRLSEYLFVAADRAAAAAEEMKGLLKLMPLDTVSPPSDTEISEGREAFVDVTHSVFHDGEPVYSGTRGECQTFADNHFPSGGYGIGPIKS